MGHVPAVDLVELAGGEEDGRPVQAVVRMVNAVRRSGERDLRRHARAHVMDGLSMAVHSCRAMRARPGHAMRAMPGAVHTVIARAAARQA
jgi:hypothetical protein